MPTFDGKRAVSRAAEGREPGEVAADELFVAIGRLGQLAEGPLHRGFRLGTERGVVQVDVVERAAPVVGAVVDVDDFQVLLEQFDRRQDAVAVQAVRVQAVGVEVRGRHDAHAVGEQRLQQPVQDHRVGDVGDVELVEADQPEAPRDAAAELVERVDLGDASKITRYLDLTYSRLDQEVMGALYLTAQNRLIATRELFRGTFNRCSVQPHAFLRHALRDRRRPAGPAR